MARVIAGSLAAGIVTALILTLVEFPGATESVITGSILSQCPTQADPARQLVPPAHSFERSA